MADELNNKKNIDDSAKSLNDFNSALRESLDLSKQLAKAVSSLSPSLKLDEGLNKKLVRQANEYNEALKDTLKLSDKVAKGKIKEGEIAEQLKTLQEQYNKLVDKNKSSFENNGRFIKKQRDLKREIAALEEKEIKRRNEIAEADNRIDQLNEQIAQHMRTAESARGSTRDQALNQIKLAKDQIKEEERTIRLQESFSKNADKIIAQKQKEKDKVDQTINAYKAIKKTQEDQIKNAEALLEAQRKQQSTIYAIKKIAGDIKDKFVAAFTPLSILTTGFELFKKAAFTTSENVTKIQKGLALSKDEAYEVRSSFNAIAIASDDIAVNEARIVEANAALGRQLGFNSRFTADLNVQFVKLTKQIGLSEEAAGGLAKLSRATGITLEDAKNVALGTSQALSSQYGIQLDQREVLEEIGKISGQTLAFFKASPQAIAQAVAQAKLLGTNLGIASKQASSLLNFESSIESELQAELLTGRQLNLERARTAALTGDLTTVMQELNNQNIDFNKFSNMNAIAQNKVAEALGLSSDELADQLLKQQYLGKSQEEVAALAGEEVAKRLEALNAQDKFNLAVEKMQDIVSRLVGGPLGKFADAIASMAENAYVLYGTLGLIAGISFTKLIVGLAASAVQASLLAAGTAATASAITLGIGAIAIAAGIGTIMAAYSNAKDEAQEFADGGVVYGKTKAIVGEYSGVENNPEVIAPLSDLQNILDKNRVVVNNQGSQETLSAIQMLNDTMKSVKEGISQLNSKEGIVNINGQRAGTAQLMGNYNLA
jgi:hypothetical protein